MTQLGKVSNPRGVRCRVCGCWWSVEPGMLRKLGDQCGDQSREWQTEPCPGILLDESGGPIKRTWSVVLGPTITQGLNVRAFDARGAAEKAIEALGVTLIPCCELSEPYCAACQREADADSADRLVDIARDRTPEGQNEAV